MLKHNVAIGLFLILWVTKLIYKESPMYAVLDKDTIKMRYCLVFRRQNVVMSLKAAS